MKNQPGMLFRSSAWDAFPALCGVGIVALIAWTFFCFSSLSWWVLAPAWLAIAFSYWWSLQCISHNFIHNPFFTNRWLNRAFSLVQTLAIGVPQILYHHYHMNHHWGDSDMKGPDGSTKDWSSIYRHSKDEQPEPFWRYCFLSFFRVEVSPVIRTVVRHGRGQVIQMIVEAAVLVSAWAFMLICNWPVFVCYYLTSYYAGWTLSYAEGYLEHYRCQPGNPYANSVSSYHAIYNFLCFNNGFHQEHHWDPKMHWTKMAELHEQIRPQLLANGTRMLRGPHLTTFLEEWFDEKQQREKMAA